MRVKEKKGQRESRIRVIKGHLCFVVEGMGRWDQSLNLPCSPPFLKALTFPVSRLLPASGETCPYHGPRRIRCSKLLHLSRQESVRKKLRAVIGVHKHVKLPSAQGESSEVYKAA